MQETLKFNLGKSRDEIKVEARHIMNSNNFAQRKHSSYIMDGRTISIKVHSLYLLLQDTSALSHACIKQDK